MYIYIYIYNSLSLSLYIYIYILCIYIYIYIYIHINIDGHRISTASEVYQLLRERTRCYVSVGHRKNLENFHTHRTSLRAAIDAPKIYIYIYIYV